MAQCEERLSAASPTGSGYLEPRNGDFMISIRDTWTGVVTIERQRTSGDGSTWYAVQTFTANAELNCTHAGGPGWKYRAKFSTATTGSPWVVMAQ